jgi:hypothetical protein
VRGIYQAIKYRSLMEAEKGQGEPCSVTARLVAYDIPTEVADHARKFGVGCKVIERASVDGHA